MINPPLSDDQKAKANELYAQGLSIVKVARRQGLKRGQLQIHFRKAGLSRSFQAAADVRWNGVVKPAERDVADPAYMARLRRIAAFDPAAARALSALEASK